MNHTQVFCIWRRKRGFWEGVLLETCIVLVLLEGVEITQTVMNTSAIISSCSQGISYMLILSHSLLCFIKHLNQTLIVSYSSLGGRCLSLWWGDGGGEGLQDLSSFLLTYRERGQIISSLCAKIQVSGLRSCFFQCCIRLWNSFGEKKKN